jgi:hypothetical protein
VQTVGRRRWRWSRDRAKHDGLVVRPKEYQRLSLAGDVAVDLDSKGTMDVEVEVGLLPTGSDGDGVILRWWMMARKVSFSKAEQEQ